MKHHERLKIFVITLLLIAFGNSYAQDDESGSGVVAICKVTEKRLEHVLFLIDILQKDYTKINWFFYQDVNSWLRSRQRDQELIILEERWHNLDCIHYDVSQVK